MELTPEERQRIYLEEQARMEARRDIESKREFVIRAKAHLTHL
jgi:hypothetical protein